MKGKRIFCCFAVLFLLVLAGCKVNMDTGSGISTGGGMAEQVVALANAERVKAGLSEVPVDDELMRLAAIRAQELAISFSHTRPNGEGDQYTGQPNYEWVLCNIGCGYESPQDVVSGWMNSPGHRRNIMYAGHDSVGAGYYQDADGIKYWCIIYYREGGLYPGY